MKQLINSLLDASTAGRFSVALPACALFSMLALVGEPTEWASTHQGQAKEQGQGASKQQEKPKPRPEAKAEDVDSIDAIMGAIYDVISGPADTPRDWDRFRSLFHESARLVPVRSRGRPPRPTPKVWTPEDYVRMAGPQLDRQAFYEAELGRRVDRFRNIAQVFSSYALRMSPDGQPIRRGINSFQLQFDGKRWQILNLIWEDESEDAQIPERYLKSPK